ncbi:hypothetical protein JW933_02670 [candidate division FCPU426 bacterium]|nr:hypothetical protein [candidate division FCPU426 bacterium]
MAHYRGTGITALRNILRQGRGEAEKKFLALLTPDEEKIYHTVNGRDWVSITLGASMSEKAVQVLYPGDPQGIERLGRERAIQHMTGIYRVFLHFTHVSWFFKQTAKLWRELHDEGQASVERTGQENEIRMIVTHYPSLSPIYRRLIKGYIVGILELVGCRNLRVHLEEDDPRRWIWHITWE